MNWLNLPVSIIRSPEYVGSEPIQRATWLNVLAYCAESENGGRIKGARSWKCRQWQQTCGVTLAEVEDCEPLLFWDGDDLLIWEYPCDKEAEVQAKREGGKKGGKQSGKARREAARETEIEASGEAELEAHLERKGKEGKGIGKEEERNGREDAPSIEQIVAFGATEPRVQRALGNGMEEVAAVFHSDHAKRPRHHSGAWTDRSGLPVADWKAAFVGYAIRWKQNEDSKPKASHATHHRPTPPGGNSAGNRAAASDY